MTLAEPAPKTRSILIVEDEAMIAMMLEEYLDMLGHRVRGVASSITEAQVLIDGGGIDLAILDCHLHGEEAWPVADRLLAEGVTVILSSGGSISTIPERYTACPMLQKPYTIGALAELVSTVS